VIYSYNKSQQVALFLNFILAINSTCFGQTYCPSSGVFFLIINQLDAQISQIYFGMKFYMFRTVVLFIVKSFSLNTQQWYMSYRFADSLRAGSGWNCIYGRGRELFRPPTYFEVHVTAHRDKFLIIKPTRCTNFSNLFWNKTLHVLDSSSVHH
jgi:hypothetical protein